MAAWAVVCAVGAVVPGAWAADEPVDEASEPVLALLARAPAEVRGAVAVAGLGGLVNAGGDGREGAGGGPAAAALLLGLTSPETLAAWLSFGQQMKWTGPEAAQRMLGRRAVLLVGERRGAEGHAEGEGEARPAAWALVSEISEETDRMLRERLAVVPKTIVRGRPVLGVEGGAVWITSGPAVERGGERVVLMALAPAGDGGLLERVVPMLAERVERAGTLGATAGFEPLAAAARARRDEAGAGAVGGAVAAGVFSLAAGAEADAGATRGADGAAWGEFVAMGAWRGDGRGATVLGWVRSRSLSESLAQQAIDETGDVAATMLSAREDAVLVAAEPAAVLRGGWVALRPVGLALTALSPKDDETREQAETEIARARAVAVVGTGASGGGASGVAGVSGLSRARAASVADGDAVAERLLTALRRARGAGAEERVEPQPLAGLAEVMPGAWRRERVELSGRAAAEVRWRTDAGAGEVTVGLSVGSGDGMPLAGALRAEAWPGVRRRWLSRGLVYPSRAAGLGAWPQGWTLPVELSRAVRRVEWGVWVEGEDVRVRLGVEAGER